ncbi:MAG: hypothetical protein V3R78_10115 [Thermodesulfobacteriota bacterium]
MANAKLTDEFLEDHARKLFTSSKNWTDAEIRQSWIDGNDQYNGIFKTSDKKNSKVVADKRLFINKTYSHIQRMHVDIMDTFFFDPEEIVSVASWKSIPSDTRDMVKALLNYRLNSHPINFYSELHEATLDALKNKIGIFKVYPELETEGKGDDEKITKYAPVIETLPYEDVFFDSSATWKDYYKYPIVIRMRKSRDYLERKGYKNLEDIEPANNTTDTVKQNREITQGSPFAVEEKDEGLEETFVYEIWTFLDIEGKGKVESASYVMIGSSEGPTTIVRGLEKNELPYSDLSANEPDNRSPIVAGAALPEPHQMYGKSWPEILEALQRETNAIRNQNREATAIAMRRPLLVSRHANLDLTSLVRRKTGGIVLGDDISPNAVRELEISPPSNASIQEQIRTDSDIFEMTSISPNLLGASSRGEETATEVTSQNVNANKKLAQIIKNLANTLVLPAFNMLLRLEQTYEDDEFIRLVTGRILGWNLADDGEPLREVIEGDFDLKVNLGINKQIQSNKWLMLMDRATQANAATGQLVQMGVVDPAQVRFQDPAVYFRKAQAVLGEKNSDEFEIQAQAPPQEAEAGGVASQAGLETEGNIQFGGTNQEALSGLAQA